MTTWLGKAALAGLGMLAALHAGNAAAAPIEVAVDKARVLRLDASARHVVVANPDIADVTVEGSRLLFVFGKKAGETSLAVLDARGKTILDVPITVIREIDRHVTVVHGTGGGVQTGGRSVHYSCAARCEKTGMTGHDENARGGGNGGGLLGALMGGGK